MRRMRRLGAVAAPVGNSLYVNLTESFPSLGLWPSRVQLHVR